MRRVLIAILAAGLLAAGCGGSDGEPAAEATTASTTASITATSTTTSTAPSAPTTVASTVATSSTSSTTTTTPPPSCTEIADSLFVFYQELIDTLDELDVAEAAAKLGSGGLLDDFAAVTPGYDAVIEAAAEAECDVDAFVGFISTHAAERLTAETAAGRLLIQSFVANRDPATYTGGDNPVVDLENPGTCEEIADAGVGTIQGLIDGVDALTPEEQSALASGDAHPLFAAFEEQSVVLDLRAAAAGCSEDLLATLVSDSAGQITAASPFGMAIRDAVVAEFAAGSDEKP